MSTEQLVTRRRAIAVFIPLVLLYACSYFQRTAVPGTIFRQLQQDGYGAAQIAAIASCFVVVYSFTQLVTGVLTDKFGGIRVITYGAILLLIGVIGFPLSKQLWSMSLSRVLVGLGAGSIYLSLSRESDRLFGRQNYALMLGIIYFVGYGGGLMGTMPLERAMTCCPWRQVLLWVGIVTIVVYLCFVTTSRKLPPPPVASSSSLLHAVKKMLKNPYAWMIIFPSVVNFTVYSTIQTVFGKALLEDAGHFTSAQASSIIFGMTIICMVLLFSSSIVSRVIGNRRKPFVILSAFITMMGSALIIPAMHYGWGGWWVALSVIFYAMGAGGASVATMSMQENNPQEIRTQASALLNMLDYFSVGICSLLAGRFLDHFNGGASATGAFSTQAYIRLFCILLVPSVIAFAVTFFIPETKGKFRLSEKS